ncbi:MAG: hypothetical protein OEN55_00705 [Alphaproteobacteria bacterium]|nr:hypothetical protein [Alphaproteobacteria bacterium]
MRTWTRALLLITASGLLAACAPDRLIVDADWTPRRITANIAQVKPGVYGAKNMTVVFRNRTEMRSDIVELEFIGQLAARNRPPYNIYAGRRCHGCESNRSIYIHSAFDGRMTRRTKRYRYPGRLYSHLDGQLVEETRAFFGDCLAGRSASTVVWFVRTRLDRIDWENEVVLVESLGTNLNDEVLKDPAPHIDPTLELVEQGRCREIPGTRMSTEP